MLKNVTIKSKLILLVVLPILFILFLAIKSIFSDRNKVNELADLKAGVELSTKISALVHETQKERGMTAGYLGSKGKKFADTLPKQRELTNSRLEELQSFLTGMNLQNISQEMYEVLELAMKDMEHINSKRKAITELTLPTAQALGYYTSMNAKYLNVVIEISKISKSPNVTKQLVAYSNFLLSKERAGIERAVGTNTLAQDAFGDGMRVRFNNLIAAQDSYMSSFLLYASMDAKKFYNETLTGKPVDEVNRIRNTLFESAKKHSIISDMKDIVGYGGLIHNFKNYVIRGTQKHSDNVASLYQGLLSKIDEYKALKGVSPKELELLESVKTVFTTYHSGLSEVVKATEENLSIKELDKIVKVSDGPAVSALNTLSKSLFSDPAEYWFKTITEKINMLKKIDDYLANELKNTINSEYNKVNSNFYLVLVLTILAVVILTVLALFILKGINTSLNSFKQGLLSFFEYVNKQRDDVVLLDDSSHDEIGEMARAVNENINKVKFSIEEEKQVIEKTIEVLKEFEEGDLSKRLDMKISNSALNELVTLLNDMGEKLENNVTDVLKVLDEYTAYNYMNTVNTSHLKAHLKRLGDGVNNLGNSITEMLVLNKRAGLTLNSSSETLLNNVRVVNESTNNAAASLEEISAALEEITSTGNL